MAARSAPSRTSTPRVAIDVAMPCHLWRKALGDAARRAELAARAALAGAALRRRGAAELSLLLADDTLVRTLNRRWRGRNRATNVLSFPSGDAGARGRPRLLGDVVLAYETVAREAAEQGKTLADHMAHLVTHGVLHLVGFDHEEDAQALRMERLERRILARLGVADPYRERESAHG
ncbi:MAG TPA: rRNA maturation RNase YbeY [Stellaceae bacterium]|nr:rRNA maturation RNase YbeY [Stellaceae bacterium]